MSSLLAEKMAADYEKAALSNNTHRSYGSLWSGFQEWCVKNNYISLPADTQAIAAYLASRAAGVSFSTLNAIVASIEYAHTNACQRITGDKEYVSRVICGIRRSHPENQSVRQAKALSLAELTKQCVELNVYSPTLMQARDRAILTLSFFAALRRSELVALDVHNIEYANKGMIVHIMQSKTSDTVDKVYISECRDLAICPVQALKDWLCMAQITQGPIFRSIKKGNRLCEARISGEAVSDIYQKYFGLSYSGHSGRRGLATEAAEAGASIMRIQSHTRHKSANMVFTYVERTEGFKNTAAVTLGV